MQPGNQGFNPITSAVTGGIGLVSGLGNLIGQGVSGLTNSIGQGIYNSNPSAFPGNTTSPVVPHANAQTVAPTVAPTLPAPPGSPQAAAAQQAADLAKYFPDLANVSSGVTNNLAPVNYSIGTNPTIGSGSFAPATTNDALSARQDAANGMLNGTSNGVPSTSFLQGLYSNYQNAAQDYTNSNAALNSQRLAQLNAVESAYTQGGMSTSGRDAAINDINQRFGNTASTLEVGNQAASANMDAYSRFYSTFMQPQSVAPGNSLVTPTGQTVYQGNGAAPATVMSTAQQLAQMAMQSGTMQYNPDGTPNLQPYLEQAQNYYGTHQMLGSGMGGSNPGAMTQQPAPGQNSAPTGNVAQDSYSYGIQAGLPPTLAGAVTIAPNSGDYYISGAKTGGIPDQAVTAQSGRSGIGYVPASNVPNIQQLDTAIGQMKNVYALAQQYLSPGLMGRIKGLTTNQLQTFFQTDPGWANFNSVRLQAIDYLKGLAQGGGFRTTQSEIDTAANSLVNISDNLESANAKMGTAMKNINLAFREYLPTHQDVTLGAQQSTGSNSPWSW